jgi:hypothetical protein
VKTKELYWQIVTTSRGLQQFQALATRFNAVIADGKSGIFPPATPGAWWCSDAFHGLLRSRPCVAKLRDYSEDEQ